MRGIGPRKISQDHGARIFRTLPALRPCPFAMF
jgi:hypothetical protein